MIDRQGRIADGLDLMFGDALPAPDAAWHLGVALFGEMSRHRRPVYRVHAHPDWRAVRS